MATTIGPDMPSEPASVPSISSSPQDLLVSSGAMAMVKQHLSPRSNPPPNPPFVFPARSAPSSAPSSYSRASGRRPKSLVDPIQHMPAPPSNDAEGRSRSPALPEFVFNPGALSSPAPETTSSLSPNPRSPALPDFKFNPGAGLSSPPLEHPFLSPPQSPSLQPSSPRAIPTRPGQGHKRGGSEFVGGQIRSGDAITVVSTSPTKSESGFASPMLKPTNPNPRRHAHRRSAAISNHDLSVILKPLSPQLRGSSAPSSPAAFDRAEKFTFPKPADQVQPEEQLNEPSSSTPTSSTSDGQEPDAQTGTSDSVEEKPPTARPAKVARVGFSDTLEFIPRPLSLVSSDTSSTVTARPGHSLSGSISSIISLTSAAVNDREMSMITPSPPRKALDTRPSTAGAVLERSQSPTVEETGRSPQRRNSIPLLNTAALNAPVGPDSPSPGKAPKRWSFFGLEPFAGSGSPTRLRPLSSSSTESAAKQGSPPRVSSDVPEAERSPVTTDEVAVEAESASHKAIGRKSKKKKKKVRTWAGSILTRKSKPRSSSKKHSGRRSQTPTTMSRDADEDDSEDTLDGVDATSPTADMPDQDPDAADVNDDAWKQSLSPSEEDSSYPMIDLDAALGPFNTPLPRNAEWEAAQRASGLSRRTLHSAARLSGFSGPGMHYQHRRTESAPEMPPFNRAGIARFGSNSTMADVFEEDEEDDARSPGSISTTEASKAADSRAQTDDEASPIKQGSAVSINIRVTADPTDALLDQTTDTEVDTVPSPANPSLSRKGSSLSGVSGVSDDDNVLPRMPIKPEYSSTSLHDEVIAEEVHEGKATLGGADTPGSATPSPRRALKGKDLAPVDVSPLHLPTSSLAPVSPYSMTHSSSAFPSPRSPMSYDDANRISTAPSSVTEDNFQSLLMGEPGPEVRLSMDIPSLTSSNSTMTRESAYTQTVQQLSTAPARGERPASFSSPFGRRGSLASIGRLISTSHGERSKLSIEVSLEADQPEKKVKPSKTKRLSRLMQFWKPKENTST